MWFRAKSTPGSKSHDFIRDVEAPYLFYITGLSRAKTTPASNSHDFIRDVEAPYLFYITGIVRGMSTPAFRAMTVPLFLPLLASVTIRTMPSPSPWTSMRARSTPLVSWWSWFAPWDSRWMRRDPRRCRTPGTCTAVWSLWGRLSYAADSCASSWCTLCRLRQCSLKYLGLLGHW